MLGLVVQNITSPNFGQEKMLAALICHEGTWEASLPDSLLSYTRSSHPPLLVPITADKRFGGSCVSECSYCSYAAFWLMPNHPFATKEDCAPSLRRNICQVSFFQNGTENKKKRRMGFLPHQCNECKVSVFKWNKSTWLSLLHSSTASWGKKDLALARKTFPLQQFFLILEAESQEFARDNENWENSLIPQFMKVSFLPITVNSFVDFSSPALKSELFQIKA